jgi:hypothetical protein
MEPAHPVSINPKRPIESIRKACFYRIGTMRQPLIPMLYLLDSGNAND